MYSCGFVRRVLGTLPFVFIPFVSIEADAQDGRCTTFDDDGNGVIESIDSEPVVSQYLLVSECMSVDLSEARLCEAYDANGDANVTFKDYPPIVATYQRLVDCDNASVSQSPDCTPLDADGNGFISTTEYVYIDAFVDGYWPCVGTDLSVLECTPADLDGDERVSSVDRDLSNQDWLSFLGCIGERVAESDGLWIGRDELMALPTQGSAWQRVLGEATTPYQTPNLSDQNDAANTQTLAKALVGIRIARQDLIDDVLRALRSVTYDGSEAGADSLAVARELAAYVFAADIIDLRQRDPALDLDFRNKLHFLRDTNLSGRTLVSTHEDRPNNWGTHAGATRAAIAIYLDDQEDLADAATIHRAWLGENTPHADFRFGSLSWQANTFDPVGINPRGATRNGIDVDGALPDEMRRGGSLADTPGRTGYPWEALQGATVMTELLSRNGYPDAWTWGDDAISRAVGYLDRLDLIHGGWWATGDDRWTVWLVNHGTGSEYPTQTGVTAGKNVGFTDWTHAN